MPMSRANRLRTLAGLALLCVFIPRASATGDGPATMVVPAAEARDRVGETLTVAMTVRSSKDAAPRREIYLDSEEDFRDEKNIASWPETIARFRSDRLSHGSDATVPPP